MGFLVLWAFLQQDATVNRLEKSEYFGAFNRYKEGLALVDSDPAGAIEKFDAVIGNAKIVKVECRIRFDEGGGDYTKYEEFFPYLHRGRARVNLAKKSEKDAALKLLAGAVDDFSRSSKAGVKAGESLLNDARRELEDLKAKASAPPVPAPAPAADPVREFETAWQKLVDGRRFREARESIDKSASLDAAKRQQFVTRTDEECRRHLGDLLDRFARSLDRASLGSLESMTTQQLQREFPLPAPEEVCVKLDALDWAVAVRPALEKVNRGEDASDLLLQQAAAAAPLEVKDGRPWFGGSGVLAHAAVEARVRGLVEKSRSLEAAEREKLKVEALGLKQKWAALADALDKDLRKRHAFVDEGGKSLETVLGQFPVDALAVTKARGDIDKTFDAARPDAELERIERDLVLVRDERWTQLAIESKRELLNCVLAAAALRHLLAGKTEGEVSAMQDLRKLAGEFKAIGGGVDVRRYGAKVTRVVDALGR